MLWLAVHLPALALDACRRHGAAQDGPLAVVDGQGANARLMAVNAEAAAAGVRAGQTLGAAEAFCATLRIASRQARAERQLQTLAAACVYRYSDWVSIAGDTALVAEIQGSLSLFGSIGNLSRKLGADLRELGLELAMASAPTATAALAFARCTAPERCRMAHRNWPQALRKLPIEALDLAPSSHTVLQQIGLSWVSQVAELPAAELGKRIGASDLQKIDMALGRRAEAPRRTVPEERFSSLLEPLAPITRLEALQFPLRRLLVELCLWLRARDAGSNALRLQLRQEDGKRARIELRLHALERDPDALLRLWMERLSRVPWSAAVLAVKLESAAPCEWPAAQTDLFRSRSSATQLATRLESRLGAAALSRLAVSDQHLPEWAHGEKPLDQVQHAPGKAPSRKMLLATPLPSTTTRPLWLLAKAQPLDEAPELLSPSERLASGWWRGEDHVRDYFVARIGARSGHAWVYREVRDGHWEWFLAGWFG